MLRLGEETPSAQLELIQRILATAPVRLATRKQAKKARTVVMVSQMAQLMHNNVLDAVNGYLYQSDIESDAAGGRTASPASSHLPHV